MYSGDRFYELVTKPTAKEMWDAYNPDPDEGTSDFVWSIVGVFVALLTFITFAFASADAREIFVFPWYVYLCIISLTLMFPILHIVAMFRFWAERND